VAIVTTPRVMPLDLIYTGNRRRVRRRITHIGVAIPIYRCRKAAARINRSKEGQKVCLPVQLNWKPSDFPGAVAQGDSHYIYIYPHQAAISITLRPSRLYDPHLGCHGGPGLCIENERRGRSGLRRPCARYVVGCHGHHLRRSFLAKTSRMFEIIRHPETEGDLSPPTRCPQSRPWPRPALSGGNRLAGRHAKHKSMVVLRSSVAMADIGEDPNGTL